MGLFPSLVKYSGSDFPLGFMVDLKRRELVALAHTLRDFLEAQTLSQPAWV